MRRTLIVILFTIMVLSIWARPVKVTSYRIDEDVKRLNQLNFSMDFVNRDTNTIIVYVRDDVEYQKLAHNGFSAEPMPYEAQDYARRLWEETKDSDNPMREYYSHDQYVQFMQQTAANYPSICELVQIGTSVQNRPILFLKISDNVSIAENEPEFRYVSSIHGDEVVGFDLLIRLIQLLTSEYGSNPRITNLVNNTEIWINPLANPDGYVLQQRFNANGIDLNRNYPMPNGVQHPDGNQWAIENVAMMNFFADKRIVLSANFHGGALVMNYPWDYTYTLTPDDALIQQAALAYASNNTQMYNSSSFTNGITNGAAWYVITGSYQDWNYGFTNTIDITAEIGNIKWPPASQLVNYWNQNQESLLSYMEFVHRGVNGVVQSIAGQPLDAVISVQGNSKTILTDPQVGDYHRMLLPGNYSITASSPGYISQTATVTVPPTGTVTQDFTLEEAQTMAFLGRVHSLSGEPISGANVTIQAANQTPMVVNTNDLGEFFIPSMFEGEYQLTIAASTYAVFQQDISFRALDSASVFVLNQPLMSEDFESGLGNWTVQTPWAVTSLQGNSVLTDSPAGNYANNLNRSVTIASPISLVNMENPVLSFVTRYDLESGYDFVHVEASVNGTSWTTLHSFTGTEMEWQQVHVPLQDYTNQNLWFRFRIRTDTSVTADGIYIDDVTVSGQSNSTIVFGDIDNDWIVSTHDAQAVLDYSIGLDPIPTIDPAPWDALRLTAADLDEDGEISSLDAYQIWAYISGNIPPILSGEVLEVSLPAVELSMDNEFVLMTFSPSEDLLAFDLRIESATDIQIVDVDWGDTSNMLISENIPGLHLGMVKHQNDAFNGFRFSLNDEASLNLTLRINGIEQLYTFNTSTGITGLATPPLSFNLSQNYPNPFNPITRIKFTLPEASNTSLKIYNTRGQLVQVLHDGLLTKGQHTFTWNGKDQSGSPLASGVYLYRLESREFNQIRKMMLLK